MTNRRIPFSEARQNFTSIVDEVEKFGRAVTIVRRGKPAAVIIDPDTYKQFVDTPKRKKWMLKGSIIVKSGVDVNESLAKAKEARIRKWRERRPLLWEDVNEARGLPFDDPFDCLIAGTAFRIGVPLITKDTVISESGLLETVW